MSVILFRAANHAEAEQLASLVNQAYRPESKVSGWTHESLLVGGKRISAAQILETLSRHQSVILVAINNQAIVACAHVEKVVNTSHIGMLAVNPILQRTGLGKKMLTEAEKFACSVFGTDKFFLDVVAQRTELISYYLRRGYQKTGLLTDYPISAGVGVPKQSGLKIERLEKCLNAMVKPDLT